MKQGRAESELTLRLGLGIGESLLAHCSRHCTCQDLSEAGRNTDIHRGAMPLSFQPKRPSRETQKPFALYESFMRQRERELHSCSPLASPESWQFLFLFNAGSHLTDHFGSESPFISVWVFFLMVF